MVLIWKSDRKERIIHPIFENKNINLLMGKAANMGYRQIILLSVLLSTLVNSSGQSPNSLARSLYTIDKQIDLQLKKFPWADTGTLKNSMTIKVFRGTKTFFDQTLDCFTKSYLRNDTIYIIGHMIGQLGWGFRLVLFKDSCIVASFGLSDGKVYKYNKSDTDSIDAILLPSVTQSVILSKKPSFQKGEIIAGSIKIISAPYYYTRFEDKFKIELFAYFKTAPLAELQ
jgi:hypothetical protein